jgi:hypothetical protein
MKPLPDIIRDVRAQYEATISLRDHVQSLADDEAYKYLMGKVSGSFDKGYGDTEEQKTERLKRCALYGGRAGVWRHAASILSTILKDLEELEKETVFTAKPKTLISDSLLKTVDLMAEGPICGSPLKS